MKKYISLFLALCLSLSVLTGCGLFQGQQTEDKNDAITVSLGNGTSVVCTDRGAEISLDVSVTGTDNKSVIFIVDEEADYVSIDEDTYKLTVAAGVPDGYVFSVTVVSAANKSKYDKKTFTVTVSDAETPDVDPNPDLGDGKPVYLPDGRIKAPTEYLVDDFTDGVDPDKWYISTQTWGGLPDYRGCLTENVSYTDDGILLLKAQGMYSADQPLSGAAVITRETYGAGSYSVAMKVMPRLGACNAVWTYYYGRGGQDNHEIDIELPGHKTPGGGEIGYDRVLNTNWLSETNSASQGIVTESPANDGKWHLYRFDWHTSPSPRIDYYVDGVLTHTATELVPSIKGLFWIGCWLPNSWCGVPDFEVDYMMVDWFSYVPFGQPTVEPDVTPRPASYEGNAAKYPKTPVDMPVTDYISNGTFEGDAAAWQTSGGARIVTEEKYRGQKSLSLPGGASASQTITAVYGGFRYDLSAFMKTSGAARLEVRFYNRGGAEIPAGTKTFNVGSNAFAEVGGEIAAPVGSDYMIVSIVSESGAAYADDVSVRLK